MLARINVWATAKPRNGVCSSSSRALIFAADAAGMLQHGSRQFNDKIYFVKQVKKVT